MYNKIVINKSDVTMPRAVAVDNDGNVYVADTGNNKIKKFSGNNVEIIGDTFSTPSSVAVDKDGNVYVADSDNNKIKKISVNNVVTTIGDDSFYYPNGVAVDKDGNVYVADSGNKKIKKISVNNVVTTIGDDSFSFQRGVAVDKDGNVYVADSGNNKIKKISVNNVVTTIGDSFSYPTGVAVDNDGNVYVADSGNNKIKKISVNNVVTTIGDDSFSIPYGVAVDKDGNVYVADTLNNKIKKISVNNDVMIIADRKVQSADSIAVDKDGNLYVADSDYITNKKIKKISVNNVVTTIGDDSFSNSHGVAVDKDGNVYVADTGNNKIKKISVNNVVTEIGDSFYYPNGVAVDNDGNVYLAEIFNNKIKKISVNNVVTEIGDSFYYPNDVAVDKDGNVYVADSGNNKIKKISVNNVVTEIGDSFSYPRGVAVDKDGNVYVADTGNKKIKKISVNNVVTTIGDSFSTLNDVAVDKDGNVYVTDNGEIIQLVLMIPILIKPNIANYVSGSPPTKDYIIIGDLTPTHEVTSVSYLFSSNTYNSSTFPILPGNYTVTIEVLIGNHNSSYSITYESSIITVSPRPITLNTTMADYVTGTPSNVRTSITGFLNNGDKLFQSFLYNSNTTPPNVIGGPYTLSSTSYIHASDGTDVTQNYIITNQNSYFNVLPTPLTTVVFVPDYIIGSPPTPISKYDTLMTGHSISTEHFTYLSNGITYTSLPNFTGTFKATVLPTITNGTEDVTSMYSFTPIETQFNILQIPLTITAVTPDYPIGKPSTPSFTVTGLVNEDRDSATFTYQENMPSVSATYEQRIETYEIKDKNGNDVLYKYNVQLISTTFKVKKPVLITYKVNNYEYGTIGTAYPVIEGYDGNVDDIIHETSDLPTKVGTYTISGTATVPYSHMYHITYKKTSFRVLPRKIIVKPIVTGTTVTPELIGGLRDGDTAEYVIRYGTSETPVSGRNRVTVRAVLRRGTEVVTSNYTILCYSAIVNI